MFCILRLPHCSRHLGPSLAEHPEVRQILADFVSNCLVEQPVDVIEYARDHFKGTATVVDEAADEQGEAADDLDNLDDLDAMVDGDSELTKYLKM